jgi:DNA-binding XRE family transcriptional regulator
VSQLLLLILGSIGDLQGFYTVHSTAGQQGAEAFNAEQRASQLCAVFGQRLRQARLRAGLSESDVEIRTGISQQCLNAIEGGIVDPTIQTMGALAQAVRCELWTMLTGPP